MGGRSKTPIFAGSSDPSSSSMLLSRGERSALCLGPYTMGVLDHTTGDMVMGGYSGLFQAQNVHLSVPNHHVPISGVKYELVMEYMEIELVSSANTRD